MHTFDLWSPGLVNDRTIEFDVTSGLSDTRLNVPSRSWIVTALADLRVDAEPGRWTTTPLRTNFYSDYVEESEWRDRWRKAWTVRVDSAHPIAQVETYWTPVPTDAFDDQASSQRDDAPHDATALVAAVFADEGDLEDRIRKVIAELVEQDPMASEAGIDLTMRRTAGSAQARVVISRIGFPRCVSLCDRVRDELKQLGGAISWKHGFRQRSPVTRVVATELDLEHVMGSVDALRKTLASRYPGLLGERTGAALLAERYSALADDQRLALSQGVAAAVSDVSPAVRDAAIEFFQLRRDAPDGGALVRALASRVPAAGEGRPPHGSGEWLFDLGRTLAERAIAGDTKARDALRHEALSSGRAGAVVFPLFMADRGWLVEHAADVIGGTPRAADPLFAYLAGGSHDMRSLIEALRGRVPSEIIRHALESADVPDKEELIQLL